ncbi:MAG: hypothetical protein AAFY46_03590 [Planctomycetota bacterium]
MLAFRMTWVDRRLGLLIAVNLIACVSAVALAGGVVAAWMLALSLGLFVVSAATVIVCAITIRVLVRDHPPRLEGLVTLLTFNAMLAVAHLAWVTPAFFYGSVTRAAIVAGAVVAGVLAVNTCACFALTTRATATNACANCGYDITGLPACPECGRSRPTL